MSCITVSTLHKVVSEISLIVRPTHKLEEISRVSFEHDNSDMMKKVPVSRAISHCHFACNNLRTAEWISIKFNTGNFSSSWLKSNHNNGHFI